MPFFFNVIQNATDGFNSQHTADELSHETIILYFNLIELNALAIFQQLLFA